MPYVLSPIIKEDFQGMWFEGKPYKKETIYDINSTDPKSPPVNYSAYTLKPHSLPHIEGSAHTQKDGKTVDQYFKNNAHRHFWGKTLVVKLKGNGFKPHPTASGINIWEVTLEELKTGIMNALSSEIIPDRLLLSLEVIPETAHGVKGEEYEVVIAVGLLKGKVPHWNSIIKESITTQNSEANKLLYVISSRAKSKLYLFSETGYTTKNRNAYEPTNQLDQKYAYDK